MEDFIELGIEGVDKVVDKHFHKLPHEALHIHTYHPRNVKKLRKSSRRNSARSPSPSSSDTESERKPERPKRSLKSKMSQSPGLAGTFSPVDQANPYAIPPQYSREPPHLRQQYMPSPPPIGSGYYPPAVEAPPYSALERRGRDFDDTGSYYSNSYRQSPPRRPKAIARRSSSYHGPRDRDYGYDSSSEDDGKALAVRRRRNSMSHGEKVRDTAHRYGLKEEIEKNFTKTPAGITGGVVGAVVGGWAARKMQTARDGGHHGKTSHAAVTLLGAAVGGLAVNAIIDKWEDKKLKTEEKQDKWEEKYGARSEDESDGGRSSHRSRRDRRDSRDSRDD